MFSTQVQATSHHAMVWESAVDERNQWLEALVSGVIALYFAVGLLGTFGIF